MIALDTHIILWDALAPNKLSPKARQAISDANQNDGLLISDISLWEIAMLIQKGRLHVATDVQSFLNLLLQANQIHVAPISPEIATISVQLPPSINKDPADRLIAAMAIAKKVPLITADRNLQNSTELDTIW